MSRTPVPVLTAVTDARLEAALAAGLSAGGSGVSVVRRCLDLTDLLAAAVAGPARVALVSADLRRLDSDALGRLAAAGVRVVAVVRGGDQLGEQRVRQLGVAAVVAADAGVAPIAAALTAAATAPVDAPRPPAPASDSEAETGRVVAVWGPTGAPGRTTVAIAVAAEAAAAGVRSLLVDADVYGGCVAQLLGVLDEAPGLVAAARAVNAGTLHADALPGLARAVTAGLDLLSGISRADRWPELRPAGVEAVLAQARVGWPMTVVDTGFCLEQDEELFSDVSVPRRNGATVAALTAADRVVVVGAADPVGLHRLVRALADLRDTVPTATPEVVLNRVRKGQEQELTDVLARFAGVRPVAFVPFDPAAVDAATAAGRSLVEAAPTSAARTALRELAARLHDRPLPRAGWRRRRQSGR